MYGIIFGNFQHRPEPSKQMPGFAYKDQGPATGPCNGLHRESNFLAIVTVA